MDTPIHVAFLWHMHQPDYRDPADDRPHMPWVRLHAARAYFDMAWLLERFPRQRAAFNFVPVLTEQIEAFLDGQRDRWWSVARKPARRLDPGERAFLLRTHFSINWDTGVRPRPRYWSLLNKRGTDGQHRPASEFSDAELRDLQVLFNLAWFGFAARVEYPLITALEQKGRDFTEDEKRKVLDLQIAVMRRVLPMYRRLAESGRIEITTTPYHHPILPLLIDTDTARRCQPDAALPPRAQALDDAAIEVERAIDRHAETFGVAVTGVWPAEGAVSPEAVALLAERGAEWFVTDEAQLWGSVPGGETRRADLYRPYRVCVGDAPPISAVFRDRTLSDLIGFTYARNPPDVAVDDLIGRIERAGDSAAGHQEPPLVTIALDGENPWETYPQSGEPFLRTLYTALDAHPRIETVCIGAHLTAEPAQRTLTTIKSGSWINGDYSIWIGGEIENAAWQALAETRAFYRGQAQQVTPQQARAAHDHLLAAAGSDWFWWYGDPFHSEHDAEFDHLFRARLRAVYETLGSEAPRSLRASLYPETAPTPRREPRAFVSPRFGEGESTYYDWVGGGLIELGGPSSVMYSSVTWFTRLRYGFDLTHLYLRLEPPDRAPDYDGVVVRINVRGQEDHQVEIPLADASRATVQRVGADLSMGDPTMVERARFRRGVLEVGIPFVDVNLAAGERGSVTVHLTRGSVELDRYPPSGTLDLVVPDEFFEDYNWTV